jgi:LacI family transcriptional regulator
MSVTISDVAKRAGVTKTTVSLVLNKKNSRIPISEKTVCRVLKAAEELNYRPSFSAKCLASGRTFSIGLLGGEMEVFYSAELIAYALSEITAKGYHLLLGLTSWDIQRELAAFQFLRNRGVDGMLMWTGAIQPDTTIYKAVVDDRFPVVSRYEVEGLPSVFTDWSEGMDQAVAFLKSKGIQKIGFLTVITLDRKKDPKYLALANSCLKYSCDLIVYELLANFPLLESITRFGIDFAAASDRPRALIASDYTAMGVINAIRSQGLTVPNDLSVIGMDGSNYGSFFYPPLTTIAQDKGIVSKAVELLIEMIEKGDWQPHKISLKARLIIRGTA